MFAFSKLVNVFLHPFIWILILAAVIFYMKKGKKRKIAIIGWFVMIYLFSTHFILHLILAKYEMPYQALEKGKIYDCAIVLSGASYFDTYSEMLQFNDAAERIVQPVILYKKGRVKKLLISGGSGKVFPPHQKEAVYVSYFWKDIGIPEEDILVESESRNTSENALFSKKILDTTGIKGNVLLITSALHAPRAKYIYEKLGVKVDYYPVDFMVKRDLKRRFRLIDQITPKADAMNQWAALIHEWVGLLAARFQ
ncbi:MAG: YdcF family protein [Flavobacteriales bacterium]|nr:YdcF family protein [Flavobacteriales bacterium]